jgi:GAF domain-containing protein
MAEKKRLAPEVEIAALKAELSAQNREYKQSLKVQTALYQIADAASSAKNMGSLYKKLHKIVGRLMYAKNFFIAIYDENTDLISWPYYADESGDVAPDPTPLRDLRGGTSYVIRTGRVLHFSHDFDRLVELGEMQLEGTKPVDGIGLPLKVGKSVIGGLAIQSHIPDILYSKNDIAVLTFVAQHIATALTRIRALEETQQRKDELAILNSVGEAMAKTLDVKTVTKIVGDKVRDIFNADVSIMLFNSNTNLIHNVYEYDRGEGGYVDYLDTPIPLGKGLTSKIIETHQPLLLGNVEEQIANGAYIPPEMEANSSGVIAPSWLGAPIIASDEVLGSVNLSVYREHAFSENDLRLLETLASNMGVAIQNAHLFEAEQERVAELAIINSVQEGLAKQLDFQGIIDLIGDKVQEIFNSDTTAVGMIDPERDWLSNAYYVDRGERLPVPDGLVHRPSLVAVAVDSQKPLLFGTKDEMTKLGAVQTPSPGETVDKNESFLGVPILSGDKMIGMISVQSYQQNAYGQDDLRLMQTLANSMSIALQNAQSFKAEQERVAELQIINSIQQGLAAELDFQAIVDLVGDKLREVFMVGDISIDWFDEKNKLIHFIFAYEHGVRLSP